ncbi:helix-turn-helix domain-containing protein [Mongoliibacter ruber]|uniref:Helix-turn-helix protein n=1 Tax=Mongoliibacter ruber TaxID=1750599 RepID=A0A2T0WJV0_9BACT|nr:helix-turn-helix transcriptional regulator [Mongoliibacter ruber]PRY86990.1 helix-turn-helix protein [Mongoliibacter ruber]
MRQKIKIPRIVKIEKITGHKIQCMFNNGENRLLDFEKIFKQWNVTKNDFEYTLLDGKEFKKVKLRNYTLSWPNIEIQVKGENGESLTLPYEIGADVLFELSEDIQEPSKYRYGRLIKSARLKAGLTQEQLAMKSGTTRFYISRIENDKTDLELSTFRKIVEAGLGKKLKLTIE